MVIMNEKIKTPEKLKQVATKLFAQKGYNGTSTKDICELAKVNGASITYHFGTKENLLKSIMKDHLDDMNSLVFNPLLEVPKTIEEFKILLRSFCNAWYENIYANPDIHFLIQREGEINPIVFKSLQENKSPPHEYLLSFFKKAKKNKIISDKFDFNVLVHSFLCLILGPSALYFPANIFPELNLRDIKKRKHYFDTSLTAFFDGVINKEKN